MAKLDHLTCAVCATTAALDTDLAEWRFAAITTSGSFYASHSLGGDSLLLEDVVSGLHNGGECAIVCGQLHALAIFERFLHRGTFVPTTNAAPYDASTASIDVYAELT